MSEHSSPPPERRFLSFKEFFAALSSALACAGVRFCILRNYEGFPDHNIGSDVDILILPSDLPRAVSALRSIGGIRVVGYTGRPSAALTFSEGICSPPGARALQVDFILSIAWKGLPYLPVEEVLGAAIPRGAGSLRFDVPSPVHESIISLLSSLLIGGWLKERYLPRVQSVFAGDRLQVVAALQPKFGRAAATQLTDAVIAGDRRRMLDCVRTLRISLLRRSLLHRPLRGTAAIVRHYASEFAVRFSPRTVETVCIAGLDDGQTAAMIDCLMPMLNCTAMVVERHSLKGWMPLAGNERETRGSRLPPVDAPGLRTSMFKVVQWLLEEWRSRIFGKRDLTLRICERPCHDIFIDASKYGYTGPAWFARLAGQCFPASDLWVLLDPELTSGQDGDKQLPVRAGERLAAYRSFVKRKKAHVIIDANKPAAGAAEDAFAAIIATLAQRTDRILKN